MAQIAPEASVQADRAVDVVDLAPIINIGAKSALAIHPVRKVFDPGGLAIVGDADVTKSFYQTVIKVWVQGFHIIYLQ
jgi:hypothetical protein